MKILIWFACVFVASIIKALLFGGKSLGALPTMILYGIVFGLAGKLTTIWEERKHAR